jgi:hypothetical protein
VLSEVSLAAAGRCYVVGLKFDNPPAERRERFVVVGIDPLWVFRKEDYDKLAHWEHPMELPQPVKPDSQSPDRSGSSAAAASDSATDNDRS